MLDIIDQDLAPAVPCALKHCLPNEHNAQALATLSQYERQRIFQYWVECTRIASSALSLGISTKENLMCPLLWCRTSFKDLKSHLHHISSCPWLSDAWYWCPYCCRPEQFMESKFKSPTKARQEEPESEKLFSQAVAFFKTFGCKANGCLRSSSLPSPDAPIGYPCANIYGPDRRFELGDTSGDMSRPVQLDSNKVHNMDNKAQWITPGASISLHCKEYTETTTNLHPRESDPRSNTPQSINSNGSITAVSVQCGNSSSLNDVIGSKNTTVISHVSLIQGSYVLPRNDNRTPPLDKSQVNTSILRPFIPTYARSSFDGHQIPVRRTHDTSVPASIAYIAADSSHNEGHNEGKSNSHAHITNLRAVVRAMSEEWIRRLALSTNTPQLYAEQYACALFELGVRALRNYFRGAIPSSFHDVFALLHVAVASSYIIHKNDHTHSWNAYLEEACQWQHLLSDVMERGTFVKVIRRLCHPQGSTASSSSKDLAIDDVLLPAEHATLVRLFGHLSSACVDVTIQEEGDRSRQQPTTDNGQIRLPGTLQSTVIVQECTDFLDNFAHAVIVEDLVNRQIYSSWYIEQHVPGIETLDSNIIGRLHEWEGLEAFRGVVTKTQNLLRCGLLHTARDVEVMLVWSGKSYSRSPQLLQKYLYTVKHLCDEVMKEPGLHWRNKFYEAILGTVLATASELSPCRGHAIQSPPATSFDNLNMGYNAGTGTASVAMPPAEPDASSPSSPYLRQTSSAPSDDACYCPDPSCKASFTGSSQRTNLERHLRTALHHNQDTRFKCEICQMSLSRPDNLQQHLRNIHGLEPVLKRQRKNPS